MSSAENSRIGTGNMTHYGTITNNNAGSINNALPQQVDSTSNIGQNQGIHTSFLKNVLGKITPSKDAYTQLNEGSEWSKELLEIHCQHNGDDTREGHRNFIELTQSELFSKLVKCLLAKDLKKAAKINKKIIEFAKKLSWEDGSSANDTATSSAGKFNEFKNHFVLEYANRFDMSPTFPHEMKMTQSDVSNLIWVTIPVNNNGRVTEKKVRNPDLKSLSPVTIRNIFNFFVFNPGHDSNLSDDFCAQVQKARGDLIDSVPYFPKIVASSLFEDS